jgi:ketosteroid isomerase-like protein
MTARDLLRPAAVAALLFVAAPPAGAATAAPDSATLARLLVEFLDGAGRNDLAAHERFWADDLIYTGSSGRRVGKADILGDVRGAKPAAAGDPVIAYAAEDVRIQQYGQAALVAFRLVATTTHAESTQVARYLNSGFLVKRSGRWQVVGWQATKMP